MMIAARTFNHMAIAALIMLSGAAGPALAQTPPAQPEAEPVPFVIFEDPLGQSEAEAELDKSMTGSIMKPNELLNYCFNIADEATEARHAVLTEQLSEVEGKVDEKLDQLQLRIQKLRSWIERREQFLASANDSLVEIFQTMRPDSAASQLTEIGPGLAAAIIAKLEPKYSSAILAEMKPADAAKIATVLTGVLEADDKAKN